MGDGSIDLGLPGFEGYEQIGGGGFGAVYRASQPAYRRTVAIKVLSAAGLDEKARRRFERECQAMGSLSAHPGIVSLHEAGFAPDGRPYLVMEHMAGGSLADRLERLGPVPWREAVGIGADVAEALAAAHDAGVIHRDVKPGNLLVSEFGDVRLSDFGIARIAGGTQTASGVISASIAHAPPEVLAGHRPTVASDVYSLGSTIYELIAGQAAFVRDTDESLVPIMARIATDPVPDLRNRGVPEAVFAVLATAMAKEPAARQQSARQFGRDLREAAAGNRAAATTLVTATRPRHGRRGRAMLGAVTVAAVLLGGGAFLALSSVTGTDPPRAAPGPTPGRGTAATSTKTTTTTAAAATTTRMTTTTTAATITSLPPVTAAESAPDPRLTGLWSAPTVIRNPGSDAEPRDWAPVVEVYEWSRGTALGDTVGRFAYRAPTLRCVGTLTFVGVEGPRLVARERLPAGSPCDDGGLVVLTVVTEGVVDWFYELDQAGKSYTASADLRPDTFGFPGF